MYVISNYCIYGGGILFIIFFAAFIYLTNCKNWLNYKNTLTAAFIIWLFGAVVIITGICMNISPNYDISHYDYLTTKVRMDLVKRCPDETVSIQCKYDWITYRADSTDLYLKSQKHIIEKSNKMRKN